MVDDMMKLSERIIEVLERNEFNIGEVTKQDNEFYVEYGQSTPEGEDWWETLWFDGTEEGFIKAFTDRANSFDVDEEAEVWIEARGNVRGVPDSIRDLIDDAEWKKETLLQTARELNDEGLEEDREPITKDKFMEYIEENFTLNKRTCLDLLESIFDYAEEHNHTKHNYMLEDLIGDALDLSDNERQMLCRVE